MELQLKGTNGKLIVYDDRIVISRKTFGGFANFGMVSDRTIYYKSIQGVELSTTSIRIIMVGDNRPAYKLSEIKLQQKDANTIMFLSPSKRKIAKNIYEIISQKINKWETW